MSVTPIDPGPCTHEGPIYRRGMCRKHYREWLTVKRAHEFADEHPREALRTWDASRARSGKTARARAEGQFGVGPSDLNACPKAVEYRERPPEDYEPIPLDKEGAWIGSLIDLALKKARKVRYPWRMFDVVVHVPGLDRPGEADEYDPIIGRVTDYKSAGRWKWDLYGAEGPPEGEWDQLAAYALGLEDAGHEVRELEVIAINRESGTPESHRRPYNRRAAMVAVSKLHAMLDALHAGRSLPRARLGPTTDPICARFCPAVKHCWSLDSVPQGRTPEGYLLVRDDEDVAEILRDYLAHSAAEKPAKDGKTYIRKALLEGVEAGRYGDVTLAWPGGNLSDPKPDPAARIAQLEGALRLARELGIPPEDPEALPYPTTRTTSAVSISVKPVRQAILDEERRAAEAAS